MTSRVNIYITAGFMCPIQYHKCQPARILYTLEAPYSLYCMAQQRHFQSYFSSAKEQESLFSCLQSTLRRLLVQAICDPWLLQKTVRQGNGFMVAACLLFYCPKYQRRYIDKDNSIEIPPQNTQVLQKVYGVYVDAMFPCNSMVNSSFWIQQIKCQLNIFFSCCGEYHYFIKLTHFKEKSIQSEPFSEIDVDRPFGTVQLKHVIVVLGLNGCAVDQGLIQIQNKGFLLVSWRWQDYLRFFLPNFLYVKRNLGFPNLDIITLIYEEATKVLSPLYKWAFQRGRVF